MKNHLKKIIKEFNEQKDDEGKFRCLLKHRGIFMLMLDNDETYIRISEQTSKYFTEGDLDMLNDSIKGFSGWLGNDDGVFSLLNAIEIPCDGV